MAEGDAADIDLAVKAAQQGVRNRQRVAQNGCPRARPPDVSSLADLMEEEIDELAALESLDNGKPVRDSRAADLPLAIDCLRYYAGWADKLHGDTIPIRGDFLCYTRQRADGRGGANHSLELPHAHGVVEVGPRAGRRLHDRDEAGRANAAHLPADGPAGPERPAFPMV